MRGVDVIGVGMTPFRKYPDKTGRDLLFAAEKEAISHVDKGIDVKKDVEALFIGYFTPELYEHQGHVSAMATSWLGLSGIPAFRTESACSSCADAFVVGCWAIASGAYDVVMVCGVEKMTNLSTAGVTEALAMAADDVFELPTGLTFPGAFALIAQEYFEKYKVTWEDLQAIPIKNHHNGTMNPNAQFRSEVMDIAKKKGKKVGITFKDEMEYLKSDYNPVIAFPLRLMDCCPISDGASVAFLAADSISRRYTDTPLHVAGLGIGTDEFLIGGRKDLTTSKATINSAQVAYKMAGVEPKDIEIANVHDCFTINEAIISEDLGFFPRGMGIKAAKEGITALTGDKPINTDGGLKCKGHPVGATGLAMLHEIWLQLRGEAGERQVKKNLNTGLVTNVGGTGATAVTVILKR